MKKHILDLLVREVRHIHQRYVLLRLTDENKPLPEMLPGQFVQVRVDDSPSTYQRRPISIHNVDRAANELWLLVRLAGEGTRHMAMLQAGSKLNVILPLGNGFTMPSAPEELPCWWEEEWVWHHCSMQVYRCVRWEWNPLSS